MSDINTTILIVSSVPTNPGVIPPNCVYQNHICEYKDTRDILREKIKAVESVETPFYMFMNENELAPKSIPQPTGSNGIAYGVITQTVNGEQKEFTRPGWTSDKHLAFPDYITRAVCRTDYTLLLASMLPEYKVWFEFLYYHTLAYSFGVDYDPTFVCTVRPERLSSKDMDYTAHAANTALWIYRNRKKIKNAVMAH